jgi:hypothetical protein
MITRYTPAVERDMQQVFLSLRERDRRLYAAVEAQKLGRGGIAYLAHVLDCDRKTIRRGLRELQQPPTLPPGRSREKGAAGNRA